MDNSSLSHTQSAPSSSLPAPNQPHSTTTTTNTTLSQASVSHVDKPLSDLDQGSSSPASQRDEFVIDVSPNPQPSPPPSPPPLTRPKRLQSLDILRGITIIFMVLVNTQGADPFVQLAHTEWFGYTLADWVFPNFIFMVGMAIAIVLSPTKSIAMSQQEKASPAHLSFWNRYQTRLKMTLKIIKRSILLFAIGISLSAFELIGLPKDALWVRIPGVLQRIAFCYLVLAISVLWIPATPVPSSLERSHPIPSSSSSSPSSNITSSWRLHPQRVQIGLPVICTILWFILTYSIQSTATEPLPGCEYPSSFVTLQGEILPGARPLRGQLSPSWCTAQAYLDTILVSQRKDPNNPVFDSEGTIGSLMAIVTAWFGWMMGSAVMDQQQKQKMDDKRLENEHGNWKQKSDQQPQDASSEHYPSTVSTQTTLQDRLEVQRRSSQLVHLGEWFMAGVSVTFAGTILGWFLPICKGLWTPSFTLYSAGISISVLCILIYLYDIVPTPSTTETTETTGQLPRATERTWQKVQSLFLAFCRRSTHLLICYGRNPTLIYVLTDLVKLILDKIHVNGNRDWIQTVWSYIFFNSFITFMPAPWASLIFSLVYILLFAPLMWYLDKKKMYLRV